MKILVLNGSPRKGNTYSASAKDDLSKNEEAIAELKAEGAKLS